MQTIVFVANDKESAHQALSYITTDIQNYGPANHQLFFHRIMFGAFHICKGESVGNERRLIGSHEVIIIPNRDDVIGRTKFGKDILFLKNCMSLVGDSDKKQSFRRAIIDWLLNDESKWDYSNLDITEGQDG